MNKILILFAAAILFFMVGCNRNNDDPVTYDPEPEAENGDYDYDEGYAEPFTYEIFMENEAYLAFTDLENIVSVDYTQLRGGPATGKTVGFNFFQDVMDFAIVEVVMRENGTWATSQILHEIPRLSADSIFVLNNFASLGTSTATGVTLTEPDGTERWYTLEISAMDNGLLRNPFEWSRSNPFYQRAGAEAGNDAGDDNEVAVIPPIVSPDGRYHTVQAGETLFSISQIHGLTVARLQELNGLGSSTNIQVGQQLQIRANDHRAITFDAEIINDVLVLNADFREVEYHRGSGADGRSILIRTENQLRDFSIGFFAFHGDTMRFNEGQEIGDFDSAEGILLTGHIEGSSTNFTVFSFTDEDGNQRKFGMMVSQVNSFNPEVNIWEID